MQHRQLRVVAPLGVEELVARIAPHARALLTLLARARRFGLDVALPLETLHLVDRVQVVSRRAVNGRGGGRLWLWLLHEWLLSLVRGECCQVDGLAHACHAGGE